MFENRVEKFLSVYDSDDTKRGYRSALRSWHLFIGERWLECTVDDVEDFINNCRKDRGQESRLPCRSNRVTPQTIKRKLIICKMFYDYLRKRKEISENPFADLADEFDASKEASKRPTRALTNEQLQQLLEGPDLRTKEGVRDRAALAALFAGGLRRREAIHLTLSDCMVTGSGVPYLRICMGKGNKYREVVS